MVRTNHVFRGWQKEKSRRLLNRLLQSVDIVWRTSASRSQSMNLLFANFQPIAVSIFYTEQGHSVRT